MVSVSLLIPHSPWLKILFVFAHSNEINCIHNLDGGSTDKMA
jgi:hypothetical protein